MLILPIEGAVDHQFREIMLENKLFFNERKHFNFSRNLKIRLYKKNAIKICKVCKVLVAPLKY